MTEDHDVPMTEDNYVSMTEGKMGSNNIIEDHYETMLKEIDAQGIYK